MTIDSTLVELRVPMPMNNYAINMISNILSGHLAALNVKMLAGFLLKTPG